jgi:DNA-binding GntR family transcriptional regulator
LAGIRCPKNLKANLFHGAFTELLDNPLFFSFLQQLLVLETNLFLGAFASHDRHRDMRMDIDNMSYEVFSSSFKHKG